MNFIEAFLFFTKDYESPSSFWRWASYALISSILRDNVYYEEGINKLYPNIYVVLLAESAEYRKGKPVELVASLLNFDGVRNTKVISGRTSVQAILDVLSQDTAIKGVPLKGGSGVLIAPELASFFVADPQLIPLITDMYDYRPEYTYNLRSGSITVKNLCLSLLGASNEVYLREVYTPSAIYGGLLGRTFMIKPDETRPPNPLCNVDESFYDKKELIEMIKEIKKLKGRFEMTDDALSIYIPWYDALYKSYKKYPDKAGVTQRMHAGVKKLAIILAAANFKCIIEKEYIVESILQITSLRPNYEVYTMSYGKSSQAEMGALFLASLWDTKDKKLTRRETMLKHWRDFTTEDFDKLIQSLEIAGLIRVMASGTNEISYEMTSQCIEMLKREATV